MSLSSQFLPAHHQVTLQQEKIGVSVSLTAKIQLADSLGTQNPSNQPISVPSNSSCPPISPASSLPISPSASPSPAPSINPATAMKPGYKTTEFWVTLVAQLIGVLTAMGLVSPAHSTELTNSLNTIVGSILTIVPALVYIFNRTWLKTKSAN